MTSSAVEEPTYRIALVVDELFGSKVLALSQGAYVWLVESAENRRWAGLAWQRSQPDEDPLLRGVTTFERHPGEDLDALIVRVLEMIDEHHGEFAHDPEWSEIEVLGAAPSRAVVDAAAVHGVDRCETTPDGFRLCRARSGAAHPPGQKNDRSNHG